MYIVTTYLIYLALSGLITWRVARTLRHGGRVFLLDAFRSNADLADSVNHLLVVGFYLINLGWVASTLRIYAQPDNWRTSIELLSEKTGTVLLVLGVMHFFNLLLFSKMRRRALDEAARRPL